MNWQCWFRLCSWRFIGAFEREDREGAIFPVGLYQCRRCKTITLGSPTDPATRVSQS